MNDNARLGHGKPGDAFRLGIPYVGGDIIDPRARERMERYSGDRCTPIDPTGRGEVSIKVWHDTSESARDLEKVLASPSAVIVVRYYMNTAEKLLKPYKMILFVLGLISLYWSMSKADDLSEVPPLDTPQEDGSNESFPDGRETSEPTDYQRVDVPDLRYEYHV